MEEFTVYQKSVAEARQNGELEQYRESKKCNHACAGAIDQAITDHNYELYHYDLKAAVQTVAAEYGLERVSWVLAHTVQQNEYDGRYSTAHKEWANQFTLPHKDTEYYPLRSHPVVLNSFIERLLELENSLKQLTEYMVLEGTQNTTQGNWIMGFDEFPPDLGGVDFIASFQGDILRLLEQTESVADAACVGGSFDVCYYLDYCPKAEMQEPDCQVEAPPADIPDTPESKGYLNTHQKELLEKFMENIPPSGFQVDFSPKSDLPEKIPSQKHHGQRNKSALDSAQKPSLLSQLEEGKKAAAKEAGQPQGTPKRDNGREV